MTRFETRTRTWYRSAQIVRRTYSKLFMHTRFAQRRARDSGSRFTNPPRFRANGLCARSSFSHVSPLTMASSKAWREIWIRPEVRSSRARCPSRRASFVAGSDRTRRTLNCFLLCANPTHANRAPASALARSDRISSVPSRAGVPHLGGHRRRRLAVRVLLHQADHHLPRLPVRSVPASAPRSLLSLGRYSAASARRRARPRAGSPHARHAVARTARGTARDARPSHARAFHERTWSGRVTDLLSPSSRRAFPFRRLCSLLSARRSVFKDGRAEGVHEGKSRVKEGTQWREHSIRKLMRGVKPQIFPGLNDAMTK